MLVFNPSFSVQPVIDYLCGLREDTYEDSRSNYLLPFHRLVDDKILNLYKRYLQVLINVFFKVIHKLYDEVRLLLVIQQEILVIEGLIESAPFVLEFPHLKTAFNGTDITFVYRKCRVHND